MKTLKYIIGAFVFAAGLTACVGDLDVTPIDPSVNTADKAFTSEDDFVSFLAQCYAGFTHSGSYGPNGDNNIKNVDGGFSQYYRGRYHLNGLTTDEATVLWGDIGLQDLHGMYWTTQNSFVSSFYYRIFYQISVCNEFLRQLNNTSLNLPKADQWRDEIRTIRALCYTDAIDMYGNVPFADETAPVGAYLPKQILRADLFEYIEDELTSVINGKNLFEVGEAPYGRMDKGAAIMILAKLYLNAKVYTGTARYQDCADVLAKLDGKYSLHNNYQELFLADNDRLVGKGKEIIWAVQQDGVNTQSYGVTNYLIFAATGGETMNASDLGISSGWGGIRTTQQFYDLFKSGDKRELFWEEGHQKDVVDILNWKHGYGFQKFKNIKSDGTPGKASGFVDTDFPVFRYADALLMLAECGLNGATLSGTYTTGQAAFDAVRERAGMESLALTADNLIDERGRELYLEGWRRSDLIRFGKFTSGYNWAWKGGVAGGKETVSSHLALFPIPESDKNANPNLDQNDGY